MRRPPMPDEPTVSLRDLERAARRLRREHPEYEGVRLPMYRLETNRCYRLGLNALLREARRIVREGDRNDP